MIEARFAAFRRSPPSGRPPPDGEGRLMSSRAVRRGAPGALRGAIDEMTPRERGTRSPGSAAGAGQALPIVRVRTHRAPQDSTPPMRGQAVGIHPLNSRTARLMSRSNLVVGSPAGRREGAWYRGANVMVETGHWPSCTSVDIRSPWNSSSQTLSTVRPLPSVRRLCKQARLSFI